MYDPTTARWLTTDPIGFEAGDMNLYRYVGNSPTNARDPSGLAPATDEDFEAFTGVGAGTTAATNLQGKDFTLKNALGKDGFDITFTFNKVLSGTWKYLPTGVDIRGVSVHLSATGDYNKYLKAADDDIVGIEVIQFASDFKRDKKNMTEITPPTEPHRLTLSGFNDKTATYRGWYVDINATALDPFYGNSRSHNNGGGRANRPCEIWDAPGYPLRDTNVGVDFFSFVVATRIDKNNKSTRTVLGAVRWGFYIDSESKITLLDPSIQEMTPDNRKFFDAVLQRTELLKDVLKIKVE